MFMLFLFVFCMQSNSAYALKDVKFVVYYQKIEEVKQINEDIKEDDTLWDKTKKVVKKGVNLVKKGVEMGITRNLIPGEGEKNWYSEDNNIAYKVNRVKITSEEELMAAMGVSSEEEMTNGQLSLLGAFRAAYSDEIQERKAYSFLPKVNLILTDTTGFDDPEQYPHVENDFWPCSTKLTISTSSNSYRNDSNAEANAYSTLIHEYSHCMDLTKREKGSYGLDGDHYANEITTARAAFVEGWAEYNEMIESEDQAKYMQNRALNLKYEDKEEAGKYEPIPAEKCDTNQLLQCEAINACILYRIATEIDNGKAKIYKAFTSTRLNIFRDIRTIIKKLVKLYPEDTEAICKIIDEAFYGKLTNDEFYLFVGETDATRKYIENRKQATSSDENEETIEIETSDGNEANVSEEKVKVDSTSTNPFTE